MASDRQKDSRATDSNAHYQEFHPGPSLAGAIECFWTSTMQPGAGSSSIHTVLPDGAMDIIFDFRAIHNMRAFVVGTMTQPLTVTTNGPVDMLGARFRPGGLSAFMRFNGTELVDERAELANFWGGAAGEAWHRLAETPATVRLKRVRDLLVPRATGRARTDPFINYCVSRMQATSGGVRISDLEQSTGLSSRQLERIFARHVGISPKAFARVTRFKGVLAAAEGLAARNWAALAADFGFSDQAHLVREFKAFTGESPAAYFGAGNQPGEDVGFLQDPTTGFQ